MKIIKQALITASLAAFLIGAPVSFAKAATKEDMSYLIEAAKKTELVVEYDNGIRRKSLCDKENIGNKEKNMYFGINYRQDLKNEVSIEDVFIIIEYIKHDEGRTDISQLMIRDGYAQPDGKPDAARENRVFQKEKLLAYIDDDGKEKTEKMVVVDDWFPITYNLDGSQEKERINKIFDNAVEVFKLKTKEKLTDSERTRYKNLKQEIEDLVLKSEHLQKSREELEQIYCD